MFSFWSYLLLLLVDYIYTALADTIGLIIFSLNRAKKWFRANYVRAFALCGSTCVHKTVFMWLCGCMVCDHVAILLYDMWPCDHVAPGLWGYAYDFVTVWNYACLHLLSLPIAACLSMCRKCQLAWKVLESEADLILLEMIKITSSPKMVIWTSESATVVWIEKEHQSL